MTVEAAPPAPAIARAAWIWSIRPGQPGGDHGQAPDGEGDGQQPRPTHPVDEVAGRRGGQGGADEQDRRQPSGLDSSSASSPLTRRSTDAITQTSAVSRACIAKKSARTTQAQCGTRVIPATSVGAWRRTASAIGTAPSAGAGSAVDPGPGPGSGSGPGLGVIAGWIHDGGSPALGKAVSRPLSWMRCYGGAARESRGIPVPLPGMGSVHARGPAVAGY